MIILLYIYLIGCFLAVGIVGSLLISGKMTIDDFRVQHARINTIPKLLFWTFFTSWGVFYGMLNGLHQAIKSIGYGKFFKDLLLYLGIKLFGRRR